MCFFILTSGWVRTVYYFNKGLINKCVLKAKVTPSQRMNDKPHEVSCSCCSEKGLLEIKCPYKYMNADVHQVNDRNFYLERINTELRRLKKSLV